MNSIQVLFYSASWSLHKGRRIQAISSLACIGGENAVDALAVLFKRETDLSMKKEVAKALCSIGSPAAIAVLAESKDTIRHFTVETLAYQGGAVITASLAETVKLGDRRASDFAADVLGYMGGPKALGILVDAVKSRGRQAGKRACR